MKIKKILFSVFMIAAMALMAVVGFKGSNKVDAATATETEAQSLLAKYWNNGVYTKQTVINVTKDVQDEGKKVFHAGANALERTTYYNGTELWMTNAEGTINSGYGTSGSNMTHFKKDANGNNVVDYTVKGTSMEEYYVTLDDIKTSMGWTKSGSIYTSTDATTLDQFRQFVAPMWLSGAETANYVTFAKATIEQTSNGLVMKLYVTSTDSSKVTSSDLVFAQAIVTRELYSVLVAGTRYHIDLNDNKSDAWALAEYMTEIKVTANQTFSLHRYQHETKQINKYTGNLSSGKFTKNATKCGIYVKFYDGAIDVHAAVIARVYFTTPSWGGSLTMAPAIYYWGSWGNSGWPSATNMTPVTSSGWNKEYYFDIDLGGKPLTGIIVTFKQDGQEKKSMDITSNLPTDSGEYVIKSTYSSWSNNVFKGVTISKK